MEHALQWNLSVTDTIRTTWSVLIKEVSFSEVIFYTGTIGSVLIREVSLFLKVLNRDEVPLYSI